MEFSSPQADECPEMQFFPVQQVANHLMRRNVATRGDPDNSPKMPFLPAGNGFRLPINTVDQAYQAPVMI
ncbi:hypothetical protein [Bordetella ansorpii]|uniref:hypothetical protein n=1 Tax=Bordetella ansorpii TaxID=288768 RepID=UPI0012E8639C|nr:hypothetical protein [Bordetella ansorpii]